MHHHRWFAAIALAFALTASARLRPSTYDPMLMAGAATRVVVHERLGLHRLPVRAAWSPGTPPIRPTQRALHAARGPRRRRRHGPGLDGPQPLGRHARRRPDPPDRSRPTPRPPSAVFASNLVEPGRDGGGRARSSGQTERVYYGTDGQRHRRHQRRPRRRLLHHGGRPAGRPHHLARARRRTCSTWPRRAGVARFADNVFTTINAGLDATVNRLAVDDQGRALAATDDGLRRWDAGSRPVDDGGRRGSRPCSTSPSSATTSGCCAATAAPWCCRDDQLLETGALAGRCPTPAMRITRPSAPPVTTSGSPAATGPGDMQTGDIRSPASPGSAAGTPAPGASGIATARLVGDADGVAFDATGRAWVGERGGDGLSRPLAARRPGRTSPTSPPSRTTPPVCSTSSAACSRSSPTPPARSGSASTSAASSACATAPTTSSTPASLRPRRHARWSASARTPTGRSSS